MGLGIDNSGAIKDTAFMYKNRPPGDRPNEALKETMLIFLSSMVPAFSMGSEGPPAMPPDLKWEFQMPEEDKCNFEYLPIVKVRPVYPHAEKSKGIDGAVLLSFTITEKGETENIKVLDSRPTGIFESGSIRAVSKYKYKPRVVGCKPVAVSGVLEKFEFHE